MNDPCIALVLFFIAADRPAALSDQAQKLAEQKQFGEAERLWKTALAADAKFFPALFNLGYFYYSQGRYAEAVTFLERAAERNLQDFNSRYLLGASLSKLNRTDAALRAWRAAQMLKPNQPKLLSLMIVEYEKGRYFNEAAEAAKLALKLNQDDETTYYLAIKALTDAGDSTDSPGDRQIGCRKVPAICSCKFRVSDSISQNPARRKKLLSSWVGRWNLIRRMKSHLSFSPSCYSILDAPRSRSRIFDKR